MIIILLSYEGDHFFILNYFEVVLLKTYSLIRYADTLQKEFQIVDFC